MPAIERGPSAKPEHTQGTYKVVAGKNGTPTIPARPGGTCEGVRVEPKRDAEISFACVHIGRATPEAVAAAKREAARILGEGGLHPSVAKALQELVDSRVRF